MIGAKPPWPRSVIALGPASFVICLVALALTGSFTPVQSTVHVSSSQWTLQWGFYPNGPPGPLWVPSGSCINLTLTIDAGSNFSCSVAIPGSEHCFPLNGTAAACSNLVGMTVLPPFTLIRTTWQTCVSSCAAVIALIQAPEMPGAYTMHGSFLFQGYYHT